MPVFMLEKEFAADKTFATCEKSEPLRLPIGTIIQIASKGEANCADNIVWWLEIDGSQFFPLTYTDDHRGLHSKPSLGHIDERYRIKEDGREIRLVGYNTHETEAYWMQVFVTIVDDMFVLRPEDR